MALPSSVYTELVSTTLDLYRDTLADNISENNALLARLKKRGNTDTAPGGVKMLENLMYGQNETVKWYSGPETLNVGQSDVLTSAAFDWRELNANVVISGLEKAQNSGSKESVHNLVKAKLKVAEISIQNEVGQALFYGNTEHSGKAIGGLLHLIADLPTSGVVGGIDAGQQEWWRNQYYDFGSESVTASSTTIQHAMNTVFINAMRNREMIDFFVAGVEYFTYYLESLQANQRFMSDETASAGFKSLKFWGGAADVFFDPSSAGTRMYGLNTQYFHYRPHSDFNFVTLDDKVSVNQDATVVPLYWKGNATVSNRARHAVICA